MNSLKVEKMEHGVFHVTLGERVYSVCNERVNDLEGLPPPPRAVCLAILSIVNRFVTLGQYATWF
jgi:hypothetical protein